MSYTERDGALRASAIASSALGLRRTLGRPERRARSCGTSGSATVGSLKALRAHATSGASLRAEYRIWSISGVADGRICWRFAAWRGATRERLSRAERALAALHDPVIAAQENRFDILLADGNVVNQNKAVKILEMLGHDVEITENGQLAIEVFKQRARARKPLGVWHRGSTVE